MNLEIKLFGFLRKYSPGSEDAFSMDIPDGSKVKDIISTLKVPDNEARIVIINGKHAVEDATLMANDEVILMTPIEGG